MTREKRPQIAKKGRQIPVEGAETSEKVTFWPRFTVIHRANNLY
jgi:hypothetical protein